MPALAALLPSAELSCLGTHRPGGHSRHRGRRCPADGLRPVARPASGRRDQFAGGPPRCEGGRSADRAAEGFRSRVAAAAAVALGRIGSEPAVAALRHSLAIEPKEVRSAVAEGCILCAERNLAHGEAAEAVNSTTRSGRPTCRRHGSWKRLAARFSPAGPKACRCWSRNSNRPTSNTSPSGCALPGSFPARRRPRPWRPSWPGRSRSVNRC